MKSRARHGHTWPVQSRTYQAWKSMHNRCRHKRNYKGRVTVCERWSVFENFLQDMGEVPDGLSLDRIDNSKGYAPDNCRWATMKQQLNNTRRNRMLTLGDQTKTIAAWAADIGITWSGLHYRLKRGMSVEEALTAPVVKTGRALNGRG